jgi:alpha-glucosidase
MQYTGQKPVDPLILNIWPLVDGQSSSYTLYEDGSDSESYKHGVYALTPVSAVQHGDTLTIDISPVEGTYPGMLVNRGYELRLPADWPPESVVANGKVLAFQSSDAITSGWHYEGNTLSTIVNIPSHSVSEAVRVEIRRTPGSQALRAQLDGFAGAIARLHSAYDVLNQEWPLAWSPDPLIDAWQTGDRLSYHPETARNELSHFAQKYIAAQASVQQLYDSVANLSDDQLLSIETKRGSRTTLERAKHYRKSLECALAQLKDGKPE